MKLLESNFSRRLVVTVLGIPLILAIIIGGPIPLYLFINLIVLISLFEILAVLIFPLMRARPRVRVFLGDHECELVCSVCRTDVQHFGRD